MRFRNHTIRWVAVAALVTCGAVAVPQTAFAAERPRAAGKAGAGRTTITTIDGKDVTKAGKAAKRKHAKAGQKATAAERPKAGKAGKAGTGAGKPKAAKGS